MSGLSDILDRELRKLKPDLFPAPKAPRRATLVQARSITLGYCEGSSDKVYQIQVIRAVGGCEGFDVKFQYGRRGGRLKEGSKNFAPVSFSEATYIYEELIREKMAKGYKEI